MELCEMYLQSDVAYDAVAALGKLDAVQFLDLNSDVNAFLRRFTHEIRGLEEFERQLRYFRSELERENIPISSSDPNAEVPPAKEMPTMQDTFTRFEQQLKDLDVNDVKLKKQHGDLLELKEVLANASVFFSEAEAARGAELAGDDEKQLKHVTGVIPFHNLIGFERLLWRACRGNVFLLHSPTVANFEDVHAKKQVAKVAFIVFYQGTQLENRVRKICDGYDANLYLCSSNSAERAATLVGLEARLKDMDLVLGRSSQHRRSVLTEIGFKLETWNDAVLKMKGIFHSMNKFTTDSRQCLIARCWVPKTDLPQIQSLLSNLSSFDTAAIIHAIPTGLSKPTYFKTNKFTQGFLNIVEAYGVANYMEVNPAPFTVITFPFLFAVMFGDLGHGFIMALAAFFLIWYETPLLKFKDGGEIWNTMFGGRYIIFLMGLFSMYTGLIYNDLFSKPVSFLSSGWHLIPYNQISPDTLNTSDALIQLDPAGNFSGAYYLGIDPMWPLADNKLTYTNSFKMKLSVILGVIHMMFGIVLSLFNALHFRRYMNVYFEFIPQVLFLSCIFGYLVFTIFYKWLQNYNCPGCSAPSLLIMLINMFLSPGAPPADQVLYGNADGSTQGNFQSALVVIALLCVPIMLLAKPLLLKKVNTRAASISHVHLPRHNQENDIVNADFEESAPLLPSPSSHLRDASAPFCGGIFGSQGIPGGDSHGDDDHAEFNFGEVMVHQAIHTIEFCLGCISNTASYLRLWALSLAHGQLSEVLWEMVLHNGFGSFYLLFAAFAVWAVMTLAVLLIMEGLSAFLHALRLHWVEFQNKFYGGNGKKFLPFSFRRILSGVEDE